jgi:hypothetical protein
MAMIETCPKPFSTASEALNLGRGQGAKFHPAPDLFGEFRRCDWQSAAPKLTNRQGACRDIARVKRARHQPMAFADGNRGADRDLEGDCLFIPNVIAQKLEGI